MRTPQAPRPPRHCLRPWLPQFSPSVALGADDVLHLHGFDDGDGLAGLHLLTSTPGLPPREDKIAAVGVKLRKWVSFHGVSPNVEPDLSHFTGIVPCGITEHGVTSLVDLGLPVTVNEADAALKASSEQVFRMTQGGAPAPELTQTSIPHCS